MATGVMRMQALGVLGHKHYVDHLQLWVQQLLLQAPNLTALSMYVSSSTFPIGFWRMPLKYLELTMVKIKSLARFRSLLVDVSHCLLLEVLKVRRPVFQSDAQSLDLPDVHLHTMASLKYVKFEGWFPKHQLHLPPECLLRLQVALREQSSWDNTWQSFKRQTKLLTLIQTARENWPAGLEEFSRLQYMSLEFHDSGPLQPLDVGILQHIPHVRLQFHHQTSLCLTSGSWQSLEVIGVNGIDVYFSDINHFVKGTKNVLFVSAGQQSNSMFDVLREACHRHSLQCHVCEHEDDLSGEYSEKCIALSNRKAVAEDYAAMYARKLVSADDFWVCKPFVTQKS